LDGGGRYRTAVVREGEVRLGLTAAPESVGEGRRFVRSTLEGWGHDALVDTASLLVSELVTNAVLHARTAPTVVVRLAAQLVRVEVIDGSNLVPRAKPYGVESSTGRGLLLVDRLAAAWGTEIRSAGKVVWFELHVEGVEGDRRVGVGAFAAAGDPSDLDALAASLGGWEDPPDAPSDRRPRARAYATTRRRVEARYDRAGGMRLVGVTPFRPSPVGRRPGTDRDPDPDLDPGPGTAPGAGGPVPGRSS
jgi:anti-sigma regulatory factor (Ser/Thr protein kinase)